MISALREIFFSRGLGGKSVQLPATVVSVGNVSMGGTGKSPFVILLAERALASGKSVAVLTRGYKRKKKNLEIVAPQGILPSADQLGDEPWMIKNRLPGISLLVHADRMRKAERHWMDLGKPNFVLLDDGFQHWRGIRDFDVVMLDPSESLKQRSLPFGKLRESAEALGRADLVVVTRAASLTKAERLDFEAEIRSYAEKRKDVPWKKSLTSKVRVIFADYEFQAFIDGPSGEICERPTQKSLLLVSGVAKPDGVRALAHKLDLPVKEEIYFPDHHRLRSADLLRIRASLKAHGDSALLLTEKDWARWRESFYGLKFFAFRVGFRLLDDGEKILDEFCGEIGCSTSA